MEQQSKIETPQHRARVKESERKKRDQVEKKFTYYRFMLPKVANEKKGRKVQRVEVTSNGATSHYEGWEVILRKQGKLQKWVKDGLVLGEKSFRFDADQVGETP
jgi:hypothetical protein